LFLLPKNDALPGMEGWGAGPVRASQSVWCKPRSASPTWAMRPGGGASCGGSSSQQVGVGRYLCPPYSCTVRKRVEKSRTLDAASRSRGSGFNDTEHPVPGRLLFVWYLFRFGSQSLPSLFSPTGRSGPVTGGRRPTSGAETTRLGRWKRGKMGGWERREGRGCLARRS